MKYNFKTSYFKPEKQGIIYRDNECQFACAMSQDENIGVLLYTPTGEVLTFPFLPIGKNGILYGIKISGEGIEKCFYNFYQGKEIFTDPYTEAVHGLEIWGTTEESIRNTKGCICKNKFDWGKDTNLMTPYEDTIIYGLNIRAFTMHKSAGVKHNGTFEGVCEKIPYLKELGVTAVELMPCYEYEECLFPYQAQVNETMQETTQKCNAKAECKRLNCWGFQKGFYFAAKASYSAINDGCVSLKNLVKELHQNKIEILMQFYFPANTKWIFVLDVLKYWVKEYHIDGFRVSGTNIPYHILLEEPLLKNTKLWFNGCDEGLIEQHSDKRYKNIALDEYGYRDEIRRFLKGDEGLINKVLYYQKSNPSSHSVINFLADYDGYSLYDMVSYERKHNEENGEDNRDGTDLNYTWNCGAEGETKKKAILDLRKKQLKNALTFLFVSQGVPFLFSGDEFTNTRYGNNNAYCQDNEIGWIKWKKNQFSKEIADFVKDLILLRKSHKIFHMTKELKIMDYESLGYPDLSYHGTDAWRPDLGYTSRMLGIMLYGKYVKEKEDDSFYIAINMHWESHTIALPRLQKAGTWKKIVDTCRLIKNDDSDIKIVKEENENEDLVEVQPRSIMIFIYEKGKAKRREQGKKLSRKKISNRYESLEAF